jgi:hypothetical protein
MSWPKHEGLGPLDQDLPQGAVQGLGHREVLGKAAPGARNPGTLGEKNSFSMPSGLGRLTASATATQSSMKAESSASTASIRAAPRSLASLSRYLGSGSASEERVGLPGPEIVARVVGRVSPKAKGPHLDHHGPGGGTHLVDHSPEARTVLGVGPAR